MSRLALGIVIGLVACSASVLVPNDVAEWAEGAKDMVWDHTISREQGPPPDLPLRRVELCRDFVIVLFDASQHRPPDLDDAHVNGDLLWAAGRLSEAPEGADGGWVETPANGILEPYRAQHGPCTTTVVP